MPNEEQGRRIPQADVAVSNARDLLSGFEDESLEVKHGALKHAIEELRIARRELPDDY